MRCQCVYCAACASASDRRLTDQHLRILPHSPPLAIAELKLKTSLSSLSIKNNRLWLLSLLSSLSLPLPPQPFSLPFPSGTGERFVLITELLFTQAPKDRDTLQTPTLAHCHAPSILALAFMPLQTVCVSISLCLLFLKKTRLYPRSLLHSSQSYRKQHFTAVKYAK